MVQMKDTHHKPGKLVEYLIRTMEGLDPRVGLIIAPGAAFQSKVWRVQGLNGKEYKIHGEYLKLMGSPLMEQD